MKRTSAELTENEILKLVEKDPIGRNQEIADFLSLVDRVEGGYSFFLNASWGDGKTVFVKQVALVLAALNENLETGEKVRSVVENAPIVAEIGLRELYMPVYYNSWANDSLGDPLPSLIATIATEYGLHLSTKDGPRIAEATTGILDALLKPFNLNIFSDMKNAVAGKDYLEVFDERKELQDKINQLIDAVLEERANKLVLFIDEIDRCSPLFALRLLEEIKFLFENDRVILVFSTDVHQLSNVVSGAYGEKFDGSGYLARFYDRIIPLSRPASSAYLKSQGMECSSRRFDSVVMDLANVSNLSMRETNCFLESLDKTRVMLESAPSDEGWAYIFFCAGIVPVLMLLKLRDIEAYSLVVNSANSQPVVDYLTTCPKFEQLCETALSNIASVCLRGDEYLDNREKLITDLCTIAFDKNQQSEGYRLAYKRLGYLVDRMPSIAKQVL